MKIIRASEIGAYKFCQRAWWYQLQGYEPENKVELAGGSEIHEKHSQAITAANTLQVIAYISLILAILAAVLWVVGAKI